MKLASFVLQQAIAEGRYEDAVRDMLRHFGIDLPHAEIAIRIDTDLGCGIRAWVGTNPYEWYEGNFFLPAPDWAGDKSLDTIKIVAATVWVREGAAKNLEG